MSYTLEDLTTPVSTADWKKSIYDVLSILGVNTTIWKPYSPLRVLITAVAVCLAAVSKLVAAIASGGFLETASSLWLTLVARYVFFVEREQATFASGTVTLTNTAGGVFALGPGDLILKNTATGKTYRNDAVINIGSLETVSDVPITAIEAGADSTSAAGEIDDFVTPLNGVTVTNPTAVVGADEETDAALVARCKEKPSALSPNGPKDAYNFFARGATRSSGALIGITRTKAIRDGAQLDIYVATATGAVTGTANDTATDLGAVHDLFQRNCAPLGVTQNTYSASTLTVNITYTLRVYNTINKTDAAIAAEVNTRLTALFSAFPIGGHVIAPFPGKVFLDTIKAEILAAVPLADRVSIEITTPAGDTELSPTQAAVLGTVTATIVQQARA